VTSRSDPRPPHRPNGETGGINEPSATIKNASAEPLTVLAAVRSPRLLSIEVLAGVVTTLALIPEVISFSIIAGVDPRVSLIASVVLAISMSILGGRPAMITAAAGAVALVVAPLVKEQGVEYLLPAVILAGIIQIVFGVTGLARIMRFIPRSVMIGFVNALGILIFTAQVPHLLGVDWLVYPLFAVSLAIILILPRLTTVVPAPLVAIVVVTAITVFFHFQVPTVGDQGAISGGLPGITQFLVPLNIETLSIIWPTALSVAFVGLMETLLTAKLVDGLTDTPSAKGRESWALGVSNILAGFYGGIAGCAMIGQTVVNVKIGRARTRISTFVAGVFLLLLVTVLSGVMEQIPMIALAAVMMVVAARTVNWHSVLPTTLRRMPLSETIVMLTTVVIVVVTHNLAIGVAAGAVLAMVLFARRVAHVVRVDRVESEDPQSVRYRVTGPLFFGSSNDLVEQFRYAQDPSRVTIDLSEAQVWDASTVSALDSIQDAFEKHGSRVTFTGLDARSSALRSRLSRQLGE
jgi:SulP family sulfate permease